ncbi:MAG TPA: PPOX class F420-dependent oxidoreductase [Candidatus Limnocylindria bacterium]|nr:PPOX class F420-dependent oxidoreductase [Candidatus Limnocylindria bacterium]
MAITDAQRRFLEEKHFAVLGTVNRSGTPHLSIMWYLLDGDEIVFNTRAGRVKHGNLARDPRCSLLVYEDGGYRYLRIDGRVRTITDRATAQADIRRLALRYYEDEARVEQAMRDSFGTQERVSYRLPVTRIHDFRD